MHNTNPQKIPEFLLKLKKLVDSPNTDKLIYWNEDGKGFSITDGHQLAKEYFPFLFKHKNIFSFIRQLNMYGFHKINRIELNSNNANKGCCDDSEWNHPYFVRNRIDLLSKIQRKISSNLENNSTTLLPESQTDPFKYELCVLKSAYRHLRNRDQIKTNKIIDLERQNESIKKELTQFRSQMEDQSIWINQICGSLSSGFPDAFKNALFYNGSVKRNLRALAPADYKSIDDTDVDQFGTAVESYESKSHPRVKIRKIELPQVQKSVIKQEVFSESTDDIYDPHFFVVDDCCRPAQEYDVDDLLNNC